MASAQKLMDSRSQVKERAEQHTVTFEQKANTGAAQDKVDEQVEYGKDDDESAPISERPVMLNSNSGSGRRDFDALADVMHMPLRTEEASAPRDHQDMTPSIETSPHKIRTTVMKDAANMPESKLYQGGKSIAIAFTPSSATPKSYENVVTPSDASQGGGLF